MAMRENASLVVYLDEKGDLMGVEPGGAYKGREKRVKSGEIKEISMDFLIERELASSGTHIEVKTLTLLNIHRNPGCWILIGNKLCYICK